MVIICRYADVLVHRELLAIGKPYTQQQLTQTAAHINERNAASKRAQMDCTALFAGLYFKDFPTQVISSVIRQCCSHLA